MLPGPTSQNMIYSSGKIRLICERNEERNSLIFRFFKALLEHKIKKDWVCTVLEDLAYLNWSHVGLEGIKTMKNKYLKSWSIKKRKIKHKKNWKLSKDLIQVEKVEHNNLIIQKYLQPNTTDIKREEAQLIFMLRCRVTKVKINMRGNYDSLYCRGCKITEESQTHIVQECKILNQDSQKLNMRKFLMEQYKFL